MDTNIIRKYKLEDLSVVIVDDHEVVLEGFRSYLLKNGVSYVETFRTASGLLDAMAATRRFSVYVVDVELPDMAADDLIDRIRGLHNNARIVVNTMHEEMWVVHRMTEKQVDGLLYKSGRLDMLLDAIVTVAAGGTYYCPEFRQKSNRLEVQNVLLSQREQDVLRDIASGLTTKEIAKHLFVSENTVESHRQKLFSKLKAHNMADLIVKAISSGYINPKDI